MIRISKVLIKRRIIIIVSAVFMAFLVSLYPATNVFAWHSFGGNRHTLNGGVGNWGNNPRYYYIDSTAQSNRTSIVSAMNEWINTTSILSTPISWLETTVKTQSTLDIYRKNYFSNQSGVLAETIFYSYSNAKIEPQNKNWDWCKIRFDTENYGALNAGNKKGTAAHEIGHVMGLAHENNKTDRIMCQLGSGRTVTRASKNELQGINTLY